MADYQSSYTGAQLDAAIASYVNRSTGTITLDPEHLAKSLGAGYYSGINASFSGTGLTASSGDIISGKTAVTSSGSVTGELTPTQSGVVNIRSASEGNGTFVLNDIVGNPTNCVIVRTDNATVSDGGKVQKIWKIGSDTGQQYNGDSLIVNRNIPEGVTAGHVQMSKSGTSLTITWASASDGHQLLGNYTWVVW